MAAPRCNPVQLKHHQKSVRQNFQIRFGSFTVLYRLAVSGSLHVAENTGDTTGKAILLEAERIFPIHRGLMTEMAESGKDHSQASPIAGVNRFLVTHRTAGLNYSANA